MVTPCGVSNQVRLGRKEMKSMGKDEIEFIHEDMRIDDLEDKEQQKRIYKLFDVMLGDLIIRYSKSQSYGANARILNFFSFFLFLFYLRQRSNQKRYILFSSK